MVRASHLCLLCALLVSVPAAEQAFAHQVELPKFTVKSSRSDPYPLEAKVSGVQGRVLVEFRIASNGKAESIEILEGEPETLRRGALKLMGRLRFEVDRDWAARGHANQRFRMGLYFDLEPCGDLPRFDAATPMEICAPTLSERDRLPLRPTSARSD